MTNTSGKPEQRADDIGIETLRTATVERQQLAATTRFRPRLESLATIVMVTAACVLTALAIESRVSRPPAAKTRSLPTIPTSPVSVAGAAIKGQDSATVVLMIFSDFQCPFCARFARDTLPSIEREFVASGQVLLAFRHMPLEGIHPLAKAAAEASWCADQQGRFWQMHDLIFQNPARLDRANLSATAREAGADPRQFDACVAGNNGALHVQADAAAARSLSVAGTPAFLIGTRLEGGVMRPLAWLSGSLPFSDFQKAIEKALLISKS